jgi:aminopeptidase N
LADPDTATDIDYDNVAGVVAHEYFHNWSGNRVTCRDWFQLSLKEGFTVFRDQCFSADHGSAAVKRIEDVRILRAAQFPEDAGPLKHPIRPESYIEISNFYTATIYNKGAEIIRMLHTLLGAEKFRAGSDLYFDRHDGEAATCEDFVKAMEDASGVDLLQFRHWYSNAGTPKIRAQMAFEDGDAVLTLEQSLEGANAPMAIPLKLAMLDRDTGEAKGNQLFVLKTARDQVRVSGFTKAPALSINRDFSAPVIIDANRSADELAFLAAHDDNPFGRYEAMQQLMLDTLVASVSTGRADHAPVIDAVRAMMASNALDPAFIAEAVMLPSEAFVGDQMLVIDPDRIQVAREALRTDLGVALVDQWRAAAAGGEGVAYAYSPTEKGPRRMRNVALGFVAAADAAEGGALALAKFNACDNMTDRMAAMATLANLDVPERVVALDGFYDRYKGDALVIDKWFSTQAFATRSDTVAAVTALTAHPDFTLHNPNRFRALIGAFSNNQRWFNAGDGAGYRLLADQIIALDPINPQTAAKMVPPFGKWRRFDDARAAQMKAALDRILATPGLSRDVFEQASKSLEG